MAQITVNGRQYDLVRLDELTLDEAIVVWDYTHMSLDQLPELEGFHPGVIGALIHVSVARVERDETQKAIRRVVGAIPVAELEQVFGEISEDVDDEGEAELPPPPELAEPAGASSPSNDSGADGTEPTAPGPDLDRANGSGSLGTAGGSDYVRVTSVG